MFVTVTVMTDVCPIIKGSAEANPNEIGSGGWPATNPIAADTINNAARAWVVLLNFHTAWRKVILR
jgi:hypothetical protein